MSQLLCEYRILSSLCEVRCNARQSGVFRKAAENETKGNKLEQRTSTSAVEDAGGGVGNLFERMSTATLTLRASFGGLLMGLANLVPGISGGTMLLAAGIYPQFIEAVSDVTRLRYRFRSLLVLGCVVAAAGLGILLLAGTLKDLVVHHRWVMYSLFIGLTLGGLPVVWRLAKPASTSLIVSAAVAFLLMLSLAVLQAMNVVGSGGSNFALFFLAGLAGIAP